RCPRPAGDRAGPSGGIRRRGAGAGDRGRCAGGRRVMPADRYVLLGLAGVRTRWFGDVARWATSAALPVEFVKVVTVEEARARLRSGRPFSAVLVDAGMAALDRDLVELAAGLGAAVVAVDDGRAARSWADLGVHAVLPAGFGPGELRDALRAVARP